MNKKLKEFLKKHENDLRENNLYDLYRDPSFPEGLTDDLIRMGLNPIDFVGKSIPPYFAKNCLLTKIDIPEDIKVIDMYAFYGCLNLKKIVIPEGVKIIGKYAFANCVRLTDIYLPSTIEFFGDKCFEGLQYPEIHYNGSGSDLININGVYNITPNIRIDCNEAAYMDINEIES